MPNLSEEAKELLRKAVARAKEIPQGFDMDIWVESNDDAPCGTAGCLAFEIWVVDGYDPRQLLEDYENGNLESVAYLAREKIKHDDNGLFKILFWPDDLRLDFEQARYLSLKRTLILEQVVERWIAGDGSFQRT